METTEAVVFVFRANLEKSIDNFMKSDKMSSIYQFELQNKRRLIMTRSIYEATPGQHVPSPNTKTRNKP